MSVLNLFNKSNSGDDMSEYNQDIQTYQPMIILNPDQMKSKQFIIDCLNRKEKEYRFMTLKGPAGSGKTTCLSEIIKSLPKHVRYVGLCAPTNKAVAVLSRMAFKSGITSNVECKTVHSALGLKPVRKDGVETFVKDKYSKETYFDLMIIDECSMLDDDLLEYIYDSKSRYVMFVGDECQIGPVGYAPGEISRSFTEVDNITELKTIVRQAEGNPIIKMATSIRKSQDNDHSWPPINSDIDENGNGIVVLVDYEWNKKFVSMIDPENPDKCRALAYMNTTVKRINIEARKHLFGPDEYIWKVGETIVANGSGNADTYRNNTEVTILDFEDARDEKLEVPYDLMNVRDYDGVEFEIRIIKETYMKAYQHRLDKLKERAYLDKSAWGDFWALLKAFDDFRHIYAITCHKSQGSTFDNTFVYTPDILQWGPKLESKQILYTACTRSSKTTFFNNGR